METLNYASPQPTSTSWVKLCLSWIVIVIPAAWGVSQTVNKSLPLFTGTATAAASTAPSMAPNVATPAPATAP